MPPSWHLKFPEAVNVYREQQNLTKLVCVLRAWLDNSQVGVGQIRLDKNTAALHFAVRDGWTEMQVALLFVANSPIKLLSVSGKLHWPLEGMFQ